MEISNATQSSVQMMLCRCCNQTAQSIAIDFITHLLSCQAVASTRCSQSQKDFLITCQKIESYIHTQFNSAVFPGRGRDLSFPIQVSFLDCAPQEKDQKNNDHKNSTSCFKAQQTQIVKSQERGEGKLQKIHTRSHMKFGHFLELFKKIIQGLLVKSTNK